MAPLTSPGKSRPIDILTATVIFTILPPIFVGLRLWARRMKNTPLNLNDYFIVIALVFAWGYDANLMTSIIIGGAGQHITRLTPEEGIVLGKTFFMATIMWPLANTFVKLSILDFYSRTFPNRKLHVAAWLLRGASVSYCVATIVTAFTICRPLAYNWNKYIPNGTCGGANALNDYYFSTAIVNLLIDVFIVALPMPLLWGLQLAMSRKVALMFIFGMGFFICIISVLRVVSVKQLDYKDLSYNVVLDVMWTTLEPTLGIINACLPMLQPVASKISQSQLITYARELSSKRSTSRLFQTARSSTQPPHGDGSDRSKDFDKKNFELIHASQYPLTELYTTQNDISGTETASQATVRSEVDITNVGEDQIRIKKVWEVQSEEFAGN